MGEAVKQILTRPVQLADQVSKAADEANQFRPECLDLQAKTKKLADLLRQAARASNELYERPTRRIIDDTEQALEKALSLVDKCRPGSIIKGVFTIIPNAATSVGPTIANLSSGSLEERSDAAASLVTMILIIEEGGVPPLLKPVKDGRAEGQENAARAIGRLGRDKESVEYIINAGVGAIFAKILKDGHMKVQAMVAWTVSELAPHNPKCQDHFAQNNVVRLLVSNLAFETIQEHSK
ncbi:hypothetical protein Cgig2_003138 [Carnegiea gigantea]|uniref:DUF7792 domain-containing protein n=1 Tax=Carnegiea gigantea TaxID=171969 RepID=A0A9Q1JLI4_9CARY|nr:hypothetical protein Cgig2_003138 [Carnegiea gigantea]